MKLQSLSFKDVGRKEKLLSFFSAPPQTPSPRAADDSLPRGCFGSAARLLRAALRGELCPGGREVFFSSLLFFLLLQRRDIVSDKSSKPHCFPFPASRVRRRALIVSFLDVSRRTYFRRFERVQIQMLKSGKTCSVARGTKRNRCSHEVERAERRNACHILFSLSPLLESASRLHWSISCTQWLAMHGVSRASWWLFVKNVKNGPARGGRRGNIHRVSMLFAIASRRREHARSSLLSSLSYFEFLCSDLLTLFPFFLSLSPFPP